MKGTIRLKYATVGAPQYGLNIPASEYATEGVRLLRTTDITDFGKLSVDVEAVYVDEERARGALLDKGDLLISRSGTVGRSYLHDGLSRATFAGYLIRFRVSDNFVPEFVFYWTKSRLFLDQVAVDGTQSTIVNVNAQKFVNMRLPDPPRVAQLAIVKYLDRETRRIDQLIAKKRRLIELLEEKRNGLITEAVTKGLDPGVPMKDSDIEWLGEIPDHWTVAQLRRFNVSIQTGPFGSQLHASDYVHGGTPILNATHLRDGHISPDPSVTADEATVARLGVHKLKPGDLIFGRRGEAARVALVGEPQKGWLCGTGSIRVRIQDPRLYPPYLVRYAGSHLISSLFEAEGGRSTMLNLNDEMLRSMPVLVPPQPEQMNIAKHVSNLENGLQKASKDLELQVQKLAEYRQAVITYAVTGEIEVTSENKHGGGPSLDG